jgi:Integrase core domain
MTHFRTSNALDLKHGDLCSPILPPTPAGNKYFFLLVDDHIRFMWIRLLKHKDQALSIFKEIKASIEVEHNRKLKVFWSDRGGEFKSNEFMDYCKKIRIKRQMTTPYTPQQNRVVERRNQTIVAMTRSMMKSMGVPVRFWGEAVSTTVYILNRASTESLTSMTPYEAWYKRKPNVQHFCVFGCVAHVKKVKSHITKLEDRSVQMVLFGYEGSKAYRVYNPTTNKVHVTRDVVFEEDRVWNWTPQTDEQTVGNSKDNGFVVMYDVAGEEQLENEQDLQPVSSIISNDEDQSETSPTPQSHR